MNTESLQKKIVFNIFYENTYSVCCQTGVTAHPTELQIESSEAEKFFMYPFLYWIFLAFVTNFYKFSSPIQPDIFTITKADAKRKYFNGYSDIPR